MFELLGGNEKGFVTKDDVRRLSRDEMRAITLAFEGTDVSNTKEAEYGIIDPSHLRCGKTESKIARLSNPCFCDYSLLGPTILQL